jgi:endonuclease/exonuclease/phosphatase family metal-dependent hydrolase
MSYTHQFEITERKQHESDLLLAAIEENKRKFILTGDFNATPGSYTVDCMLQKLTSFGPSMNEPTWTTKPFSYNGFEETELSWRLDHVFGTSDLDIIESRVIDTKYSDHLPLLVRVRVSESSEKLAIPQ